MMITRELEQMESLRQFVIAEFRVAFDRRGFDVRQYSDDLISNAVRGSEGTWSKPLLSRAFDLLTGRTVDLPRAARKMGMTPKG